MTYSSGPHRLLERDKFLALLEELFPVALRVLHLRRASLVRASQLSLEGGGRIVRGEGL